ncbi:MAG: sugar kinase [Hyphomicrobiales bacterium]|nr:sugar kinase [Hyphomicrobiales bacterium]
MTGPVAVFDLGKTNLKLVAFDRDGQVLAERSEPNAPLKPGADWPYLRLDSERAFSFLVSALRDLGERFQIEAVSVTTHGAAGVLTDEVGAASPPLDYEFGDPGLEAEYDALRPSFEETLSPRLPGMLNLGRQIFFFERRFPERFAAARAFLTYPQYFAWRLSGALASEVTSLGSHTDLWRPNEGRLSSLVERLGWARLFPPLRPAWETVGGLKPEVAAATRLEPTTRVVCGAHDSNASLIPHLVTRADPFTVISTGTWAILMAVGGKGRYEEAADMTANVDVLGRPVPTGRFMGGREFAVIAGEKPAEAREADVAAIVARGVLAAPAFTDLGGPFAGRRGRIVGEAPASPAARAALATLYVALMTAHMLDRLEAPGDIIVEGGFNRSPAYAAVLKALMPSRDVVMAAASGAAEGAAMLAHWDEPHPSPRLTQPPAWSVPGLAEYRARWEKAL